MIFRYSNKTLSNSARSKDMIDKLITYRLPGVKEYWIVDQKQENVMVYVFDNFEIDKYKTFEMGSAAQSFVFKGLAADIEGLFTGLIQAGE
jgi:Uma2 family endonuclease